VKLSQELRTGIHAYTPEGARIRDRAADALERIEIWNFMVNAIKELQ